MFFFKQKTAYELRISDGSSDVCASDLRSAARIDRRRVDGDRRFGGARRVFGGGRRREYGEGGQDRRHAEEAEERRQIGHIHPMFLPLSLRCMGLSGQCKGFVLPGTAFRSIVAFMHPPAFPVALSARTGIGSR